jgi:PleD family two-component response regulator
MKKLNDIQGRILIADDEKLNVDFFHVMLTKLGFEVDVAFNGEEVLEKVKKVLPDLILLDLLMPKLSGYQVAEILKGDERTKNIPIIILTAVHDIKDKVDMIELGIEDYITKPFNFVEILARIRNNLKTKLLRDEMASKEGRYRSVERLEHTIDSFLEKTGDCVEKIRKSMTELRRSNCDTAQVIAQLEEELGRLVKGLDEVREIYKAHMSACR